MNEQTNILKKEFWSESVFILLKRRLENKMKLRIRRTTTRKEKDMNSN